MSRAEKKAHVRSLVRTAQALQTIGDIAGAEAAFANAKRMHLALRAGK